jgi:beta-xylosidase
MVLENPALRGFIAAPSFCRVGEDHYSATSTFEWWPGAQIHRSRDLVNRTLVSRPLRRASQLDMRDSCGIRAPPTPTASSGWSAPTSSGWTGPSTQQVRVNGTPVGPMPDASIISDDGGKGGHASVTGAFVGVMAHDLARQGWTADVTRFADEDRI